MGAQAGGASAAAQASGGAQPGAIVACLVALGFIALLPRIFFRPGRLNASWWLTAAPFGIAGATLVAGVTGFGQAAGGAALGAVLAWPAIVLACAAIALIGYTLGTHAQPVSLWHQENDSPERLLTTGAYARVRHPFYASFLLTLLACALAFPHALTALAALGGWVQLDRTAAREERRLGAAFGPAYAAYVRRTGRFWPGPRSLAGAERTTRDPGGRRATPTG